MINELYSFRINDEDFNILTFSKTWWNDLVNLYIMRPQTSPCWFIDAATTYTKGIESSVTLPNGFKNIFIYILIVHNVSACMRLAAAAPHFDRV